MRKPSQATVTAFIGGVVATLIAATAVVGVLVINKERAPETNPNQIAEQFDVTISWVDTLPCGELASAGGCFDPATPDVIYILEGQDPDWQRSLILHELGHVMQYRLGQPGDECKADEFAKSLGGSGVYDC